jgi:NAD(P)H-hydrate epimerase
MVSSHPYPIIAANDVGWLTREEMLEVDRVMISDLQIELIQMMENAGRGLARLVMDLATPKTASVFAGTGGNGGGGLVAARHLANTGVDVTVVLSRPASEFSAIPLHQLEILKRMEVPVAELAPTRTDLVVDALVGYSLRGAPYGRTAELIQDAGRTTDLVISLDAPSGLDVNTGETLGDSIDADATLTLALPKLGLRQSPCVGDLYLGDISVPPRVLRRLGATPPDFSRSAILAIDRSQSEV